MLIPLKKTQTDKLATILPISTTKQWFFQTVIHVAAPTQFRDKVVAKMDWEWEGEGQGGQGGREGGWVGGSSEEEGGRRTGRGRGERGGGRRVLGGRGREGERENNPGIRHCMVYGIVSRCQSYY